MTLQAGFSTYTLTMWNTIDCVYLIRCNKCGKKYVGETGNKLVTRFYQHKYNIFDKQNVQASVVKHFIEQDWTEIRVTILENTSFWSQGQRRRAEGLWIARLDTRTPRGLNHGRRKQKECGWDRDL